MDDCTSAIKLKEDYGKAYSRRAQAYSELEEFAEAVRDLEKLKELEPENEGKWVRVCILHLPHIGYSSMIDSSWFLVGDRCAPEIAPGQTRSQKIAAQGLLQVRIFVRAYFFAQLVSDFTCRVSPSRDRVLGIEKDADEGQIKKGYRAMALKWHPGIDFALFLLYLCELAMIVLHFCVFSLGTDKNSETEESRVAAEKMFKDVGEAYACLSDPKKKQRYDAGVDDDDDGSDGGMGMGGMGGMGGALIFRVRVCRCRGLSVLVFLLFRNLV